MNRIVSVVVRGADGALLVVCDCEQIACDDAQGGVEAALAERQAAGDDMVLILFADDSIARHWTRPGWPEPDAGADVLGEQPKDRGTRAKAKKKAAKKRSK